MKITRQKLIDGERIEFEDDMTPEEIQEFQDKIFVTIKIPFSILSNVQDKISQLILMFSDLKRIPRGNYLELSNIALKFVPNFLTKAEFTALKSAGVVFDENIESLFNK